MVGVATAFLRSLEIVALMLLDVSTPFGFCKACSGMLVYLVLQGLSTDYIARIVGS